MDIDQFRSKLEDLRTEAVDRIREASSEDEAIKAKNAYLGRNGDIQDLMGVIGQLPDESKPTAGRAANEAKSRVQEAYDERLDELEQIELQQQLEEESVDVTRPARRPPARSPHPISAAESDLIEVFTSMGFEVAEGPEIEDDFHNFEALNFPEDHPARDMQDTFKTRDGRLLRTHTSPVQIRTMRAYEPPIQIISPGRVYRCDDDLTHSPVFHQIEGLLVDTDVTMTQLKGTLQRFARETFGDETGVRFRPSFFPFTEPSAEMDIGCLFCEGAGCQVCGDTGWLEILGAGMVDPNVFEKVGIDPEVYTGYAFGLGVERIAMLERGIDAIRYFFENDVRFLRQF